jgi:hypothetical protein
MATSKEEITSHLDTIGLKYNVHERGTIHLGFKTQKYKDNDGDQGIGIVIALEENGEFVKFFTPMAFRYKDGPHREAVFQTCLVISYLTKGVQFEYDANDGEIRMILEFPLEDNHLTLKQLHRCIQLLAGIADEYYEPVMAAINDGKAATSELGDASRAQAIAQLEALLAKMKGEAAVATGAPATTDLGIDL